MSIHDINEAVILGGTLAVLIALALCGVVAALLRCVFGAGGERDER